MAPLALVKVAKVRVQPELGASSGSGLLLVLVLQSRARRVLPGFSQSSFLSTTSKMLNSVSQWLDCYMLTSLNRVGCLFHSRHSEKVKEFS